MFGPFFCAIGQALGGCQTEDKLPMNLEPIGTIDMNEISSILLDKLEEMGDTEADIHIADYTSRLYRKEDVKAFLELDETDKLAFVAEDRDCDNSAGILYGEFCKQRAFPGGIVETVGHRLNWFIDETLTFWFIEPQTDKMSKDLENWQGWGIKFFLL